MAVLHRSLAQLWSLLNKRLSGNREEPLPFVPMAVLRDQAQAYKAADCTAPNVGDNAKNGANPPSVLSRASTPPPASNSMACTAKSAPKLFVVPKTPRDADDAAVQPRMAVVPPFVLSGKMADVCAQLEQWADQEERWLRAG
ncbi:MAG: hypothetical protein Q4G39_00890 [Brachymonas sp.]|nr:hypothetical protein [Brachymonas sp.]